MKTHKCDKYHFVTNSHFMILCEFITFMWITLYSLKHCVSPYTDFQSQSGHVEERYAQLAPRPLHHITVLSVIFPSNILTIVKDKDKNYQKGLTVR